MENNPIPFQGEAIRKIWHKEQWYFSIVDVIEILTGTDRARKYWSDLKKKLSSEGFNETSEKIGQLKMLASDGKMRLTDAANTEGVLRIVMSIPSPKVEPLKMWLAEQGKRTIDETENPELMTERQIALYKAKGYSDEWIKERLQSIDTRKRLTDEWQKRGVKEGQEYSVLTAVIAKGTFNVTPSEHAKIKGLEKENLRDHMTPMELILTAFSEEATRQIAMRDDAQGFNDNHESAQLGGKIGGEARKNFEKNTGLKVVSKDNYLKPPSKDSLPESTEAKDKTADEK
jgi:DNA-damage-inducible protein D